MKLTRCYIGRYSIALNLTHLHKNILKYLTLNIIYTLLFFFRGESSSEENPFRSWYGRLGEVRSLVECPVILMTATANAAARKELQRKFCMKDCLEIIENPENNIKLFSQCVKYNTSLEDYFFFLIMTLKEKKRAM